MAVFYFDVFRVILERDKDDAGYPDVDECMKSDEDGIG